MGNYVVNQELVREWVNETLQHGSQKTYIGEATVHVGSVRDRAELGSGEKGIYIVQFKDAETLVTFGKLGTTLEA